mmetsp:Transcript_16750/g.52354  ORF Transcript_16750/g.52354 Transcript_16750/m.52354 type:complete len:286 (+) Transcript_16750:96-953(+)
MFDLAESARYRNSGTSSSTFARSCLDIFSVPLSCSSYAVICSPSVFRCASSFARILCINSTSRLSMCCTSCSFEAASTASSRYRRISVEIADRSFLLTLPPSCASSAAICALACFCRSASSVTWRSRTARAASSGAPPVATSRSRTPPVPKVDAAAVHSAAPAALSGFSPNRAARSTSDTNFLKAHASPSMLRQTTMSTRSDSGCGAHCSSNSALSPWSDTTRKRPAPMRRLVTPEMLASALSSASTTAFNFQSVTADARSKVAAWRRPSRIGGRFGDRLTVRDE